ncbi:MAG TPA: DoxX family protein [Gemmatimonadales bacterium]|nr:DoxX family protein [Gemmatimonadales bacterium]
MSDNWKQLGPLPLRLMMTLGFLVHGIPKLTPEGHVGFATMLASLGVPSSAETAWIIGGLEVVGAFLMLFGCMVRYVSVLLIAEMGVAMFLVHWSKGFGPGGIETNLLYIAILTGLLITGAGALSIDRHRELMREIPEEPAMVRREGPVLVRTP